MVSVDTNFSSSAIISNTDIGPQLLCFKTLEGEPLFNLMNKKPLASSSSSSSSSSPLGLRRPLLKRTSMNSPSDKRNVISASENTVISDWQPAPFSYEPAARAANLACDYSIRITMDVAKSGKAPRQVRVYADGAYDMFHSGHARQLMQAKCAFPNVYLIVGVSNDADVHRYKGRTVMNERERYEAVRHCRYVDEVVEDAPWVITQDFLQKHKIDFVAHDDIPYASADCEDVYKPLKDAGMFLVTQRAEGISTTDVIGRIVRDYDVYLRRNIKRGLSRKELNISYVKEKSLKLQDNLEMMMKHGSNFIHNFDTKRREFIYQLEDMSHEVVRSFMRIFGSDGPIRHWWSKSKRTASCSTCSPSFSSISSSSSEDDIDISGRGKRKFSFDNLTNNSSSISAPLSGLDRRPSYVLDIDEPLIVKRPRTTPLQSSTP